MASKCGRKVVQMERRRTTKWCIQGASVFISVWCWDAAEKCGKLSRRERQFHHFFGVRLASSQVQLNKRKKNTEKRFWFTVTLVRSLVANHFLDIFHSNSLIHNAHELHVLTGVESLYICNLNAAIFMFRAFHWWRSATKRKQRGLVTASFMDIGQSERNSLAKINILELT